MFQLWKQQESDKRLIAVQWVFMVILLLACLMLWRGWNNAPKHLTVYVPPDLTRGATFRADDIPHTAIYAFSFYIWQLLNSWPDGGDVNYQAQLNTLWPYLTDNFKRTLERDYQRLKQTGLLKRTRAVSLAGSTPYQSHQVSQLGSYTWQVNLRVHLQESLHGQAFKDIVMEYPLKIVRLPQPEEYNPWGLAIDGFVSAPKRVMQADDKQ